MEVQLFRIIVPVTDIDRAARFYQTVLGKQGQRVSPGRHYFDCGGTILACFDARADGDPFAAAPNPEWHYIAVDSIDEAFAACRRAAATPAPGDVHGEPAGQIVTRPWGERSFYVHDPFGNKLCFVDRATVFRGQ
ncbi:MAG: VOC family protein [Phycisphaerae bacterium]